MASKQSFFISHGSPTLSIDDSLPARHFLKSWKDTVLSQNPRSILVISGHWEERHLTISSGSGFHSTIHDFYGFPQSMYKLKYPAPRSAELAKRTSELLNASGFLVNEDKERGLDHGAWVPLMLMYPECDIPVCQLSLNKNEDATYHYKVGRALAPLKEDGVLIIGSGSATHNLGMLRQGANTLQSWASDFDSWLRNALLNERYEEVNQYLKKAPHARKAHPTPDHFLPLHVAMGAAGQKAKAELIHSSWSFGTLSYSSYKFTEYS